MLGPAALKMAKSEAGQAAGKAVKTAAAEGLVSLADNVLKEKKPGVALKRGLEASTKEVAKSVKKIAKAELEKEEKKSANVPASKRKKRARKRVAVKTRKSIFD